MKTVKSLLLQSSLKLVHDDGAQLAHMTRRGLQVAQRVQSERTLSMAQALSALTLNHLHLHLLGGVTVEKFVPTEDGAVAVGRQRLDDQTRWPRPACRSVGAPAIMSRSKTPAHSINGFSAGAPRVAAPEMVRRWIRCGGAQAAATVLGNRETCGRECRRRTGNDIAMHECWPLVSIGPTSSHLIRGLRLAAGVHAAAPAGGSTATGGVVAKPGAGNGCPRGCAGASGRRWGCLCAILSHEYERG